MKRFIYGTLLVITLAPGIKAQQLSIKERNLDYNFNKQNYLNLYYLSANPSLLSQDVQDERLNLSGFGSMESGGFREFVSPERQNYYSFGASGKKNIEGNQIFKGRFRFDKDVRVNRSWLFTKDDSNSPFLLGDSTSGDSRYNGILLDAEYANQITHSFSAGASVQYAVDEGLKTISPRPVSNHRTIGFTFGLSYKLSDLLTTALAFKTNDHNEEITYSEDEGGINKETIIYKYEGYDFPITQRKKNESRRVYNNDYALNLGFSGKLNNRLLYAVSAEAGTFQELSKDDAKDPVVSGYFSGEYIKGILQALYSIGKAADLSITYSYMDSDNWARHPEFSVLFYDFSNTEHSIEGDLRYSFEKIKLFGGTALTFDKINENDYYSRLSGEASRTYFSVSVGAEAQITHTLGWSFIYKWGNAGMYNKKLESRIIPRINDLLYKFTDFNSNSIDLALNYDLNDKGALGLYFNGTILSTNAVGFGDGKRVYTGTGIEYKLKLY